MREDARAKGRRYLTEGRLLITRVDDAEVRARCRGSDRFYSLGFATDWWCDCRARTRCAHLVALQSVVEVPRLARRSA